MKEAIPYNFGGLSEQFTNYENSKIVILPVPFDKTSTWLKGSDRGPAAIIEASQHMELYDIETNSEVYKQGIFTETEILTSNSALMIKKVHKKVKNLLSDEKFVVTLGGEHSVSIAVIMAYSNFFNEIGVLHLDAHTDMRDSFRGDKYSHACAMARVKEITEDVISVGVRSMDSSELKNIDKNRIFYADEIHHSDNWIKKVNSKLSKNVYINIDLDVFDPGIMPSTGTPEPGGLDWYQVIKLLRVVSESKNIIGFDVVELCPFKNKAPDFLAAKLIYKLLNYKFFHKKSILQETI